MTNKTIMAIIYLLVVLLISLTLVTVISMNDKILKLQHGQIILESKIEKKVIF